MPEATRSTCTFCGARFRDRELIRGAKGAICRNCITSLSARLLEIEASDQRVGNATKAINIVALDDPDASGGADERSAHDYQSRIDLAAAYREMGRTNAAVNELLAAIESALLCADYPTALRCVGNAREIADSPAVRDRICEILTRHAPKPGEND